MKAHDGTGVRPADVFKALGHPARLEIVRALCGGERCVCELVGVAGLGWSSVSRHLALLKASGVLEDEKRGMQVFYRLRLPCVARFIACLESGDEDGYSVHGADNGGCGCQKQEWRS